MPVALLQAGLPVVSLGYRQKKARARLAHTRQHTLKPCSSAMAPQPGLLCARSIRARFGSDGTKNAVHGSANPEDAARELEFFFPPARNAAAEASAVRYQAQVRDKLMPALTQGMVALAQQAQRGGRLPDNCVAWLGQWLQDNDPSKVLILL